MSTYCLLIFLLISAGLQAQHQFQLAAPFIKHNTIFFDNSISVPIVFAQPGAQIRYTVNHQIPNRKSDLYQKPVLIYKNRTTLKARSFAAGFAASDVSEATFIKNGLPAFIHFPQPSPQYKGNGANTLSDNEGGIPNQYSKNWLGYHSDSVCFFIKLDSIQPIKKLLFNMLQNQEAWIFLPAKAAVYPFNEMNDKFENQPCGSLLVTAQQNKTTKCDALEIDLKDIKTDQLKLVLYNASIPQWHQGAGQQAWLFIDEIKVY